MVEAAAGARWRTGGDEGAIYTGGSGEVGSPGGTRVRTSGTTIRRIRHRHRSHVSVPRKLSNITISLTVCARTGAGCFLSILHNLEPHRCPRRLSIPTLSMTLDLVSSSRDVVDSSVSVPYQISERTPVSWICIYTTDWSVYLCRAVDDAGYKVGPGVPISHCDNLGVREYGQGWYHQCQSGSFRVHNKHLLMIS
ncbi:hypothetical protein HYPSUDRAFT_1090302 [Hypholoma sublateritium FD-334 SS-4]|uniref:Uncharacterized protein n=1 Tax=Hypholoma sublateritium (strain FD-334 SS-4) TaxID=945553 RepID=A0A0D2PLD4_HYPSF|nr:hypothetical protein HYPSUDRAFT_1090302 [Hypholoma sublateritium FD-334 SS-4]